MQILIKNRRTKLLKRKSEFNAAKIPTLGVELNGEIIKNRDNMKNGKENEDEDKKKKRKI